MAAARKPNPKKLSPRDRTATVSHLAETVAYNAGHALDHQKIAAKVFKQYAKNDPKAETLWHNMEHAVKHTTDVQSHAKRLIKHLETTYPGANALLKELKNPRPSLLPSKPGTARGNKKTR